MSLKQFSDASLEFAILTLARTGPCAPAEVWRRYTTVADWPSWSPQITRVTGVDGRIAPGDQGYVIGPLGISVRFTILEVDEPKMTWNWRVSLGPLKIHMAHGVAAANEGSKAWFRIGLPAPIAAGYAPLAALALHRLTRSSL